MGKQFQIHLKEEWEKTESEKQMERLDSVFEQTELSNEPKRTVILYKNKIDKRNLSFNVIMTCVWFGLGFLLSGGSIGIGFIAVLILAPMMKWREVEREIEVPKESVEDDGVSQKYLNRPAIELQKEIEEQQNKTLSQGCRDALLKHLNDTGSIKE